MNLLNCCKVSQAITPTNGAADKVDIEAATLDMAGFDGVLVEVVMGAIVALAETSLRIQQGTKSDGSDMADLAGSKVTVEVAKAETIFLIDLYRPQERYVRLIVDRAVANATIASATYFQYQHSGKLPVVQSTEVTAQLQLISPDEGTP